MLIACNLILKRLYRVRQMQGTGDKNSDKGLYLCLVYMIITGCIRIVNYFLILYRNPCNMYYPIYVFFYTSDCLETYACLFLAFQYMKTSEVLPVLLENATIKLDYTQLLKRQQRVSTD